MAGYDAAKYSKVEDLGDEEAELSAQVTKSSAAKGLGKWASDRH